MSGNKKKMQVRATYEYAPGLSTTLHYPKKFEPQHKPFTCAPRTVKVKVKYEFSPGLHTTVECVNEIVLKHYIYEECRSPPTLTRIAVYEHPGYTITEYGPVFWI